MLSQLDLNSKEEGCVSLAAAPTSVNVVRERSVDYHRATVLAFILCGLFTLTSLIVPPSLSHDAAWGMQEWRTLAAGGPINTIISPDPADISRDQTSLVTWWSPGQYLIPGILTLLGIRLGTALTITTGASLLCCLLGWIQVAKHFALSPRTATLAVLFLATFRYSTLPFGIYNGGEILLQGITPWLILAGCYVPFTSAIRAAGLASLAIWIAFFAKLTGVMVASAALLAGSVEALVRVRRITGGMVAGAFGAILAFGSLYVAWFSRGATPASGTGWSFRFGDVFFSLAAPWGAGVSWMDMVTSLLFNPRHPVVGAAAENGAFSGMLWFLLPPILFFVTVILKGWKPHAGEVNLTGLLIIVACLYGVSAVAMSIIFSHGGDVSLEERHLRAAGMLIFVCVLAVADRLPRNSGSRIAVGALCVVMSLFGWIAFAYRARSMKPGELDPYSRTRQPSANQNALEFVRAAFTREGRDALFVVPSPDAVSAMPPDARILSHQIEFEPKATISARTYNGKVPGHVYVIIPTRFAESDKEILLLKEFKNYSFDGWVRHSFGRSTVFVQ